MRKIYAPIVGLASVALLLSVSACTSPQATFTVRGTFAIVGSDGTDFFGLNKDCEGQGGYDDIDNATQVKISSGATLGIGHLTAGKYSSDKTECDFTFKVTGITAGKKFYKVEVGHRGGIEYTQKELQKGPALSLGSADD